MISTTIKMKYAIPILNGEKTVEYKAPSTYWSQRIGPHMAALKMGEDVFINFLCGQVSFKYRVLSIETVPTPKDVMKTVGCTVAYAIHLGERVCQKCCGPVYHGCGCQRPHSTGDVHESTVQCGVCRTMATLLLGAIS